MFRSAFLAIGLLFVVLSSPRALADPVEPYLGTKGYSSINTDTLLSLDLHIPVGEHVSGVVPELVGQFGFGPAAVGVNLGLSYADPENGDSASWFGNIDLFVKGRHCLQFPCGAKLCFGGQLEVSITPAEASDLQDAGAIAFGAINHLRINRFGSELLIFTPTLGVQFLHQMFFAQFHIGPEVQIYLDEDTADMVGDNADSTLVYGLMAGVNLLDLVSAGVGFRGLRTMTFRNNDEAFAIDILAQVHLPIVKPYLMLSIPMDDDTRDLIDVNLTLGAAAIF